MRSVSHSESYRKEQHLSPSVALFFCREYPVLAPDEVVYLCKYICGYIGEHIVDVQSIITQTVTAIIKAFSVPITAKRKMRADSFTLLLRTCFYSFTSTIRFSSSSCFWSIAEGASSITSRPLLFLGNAMQSRILSRPAKMLTQRSRPYARPP